MAERTTDAGIGIKTTGTTSYAFQRLMIPPNATVNDTQAAVMFQEGAGNGLPGNRFWVAGFNPATDTFNIFNVNAQAAALQRLTINNDGAVGVGVAPNNLYRLYVGGDIAATGKILAKYQDIAEWVPAEDGLEAGTVVTLDTNERNRVVASRAPYDTTIAGVISPQPGIVLGEGGAGKATVATTGRVRVRVDATANPIRIGDLLTTSGTRGMAMKSDPINVNGRSFHQPGTIIGKALEPLSSGRGNVLVLLTLQ